MSCSSIAAHLRYLCLILSFFKTTLEKHLILTVQSQASEGFFTVKMGG